MQSLESSNSQSSPAKPNVEPKATTKASDKTTPLWMKAVVWLLRVVCGGVFIFSGWAKAVDPWGTVYKLQDYMAAMGLSFEYETIVAASFLMAALEFALGVMVLIGAFRRLSAWALLAFMAVMTPLTVWIYVADPVADCGCFGDALIISNGQTLAKNVVLLVLSVGLVLWNRRVACLIKPAVQWIALTATILYPLLLSLYGYLIQPLHDFRPFPAGTPVAHIHDNASEPRFVYADAAGTERSFSADSLPDDSAWTFVRREQPAVSAIDPNKQIAIIDADGDDITSDLMEESANGMMLLCVSDPKAHGISRSRMANTLYTYLDDRDIPMVAVVATDSVPEWTDMVKAEYPVYSADDTDIKMLVRGHAALVYVQNDTVRWKYSLYCISPEVVPVEDSDDNLSQNRLSAIAPVEDSPVLSVLTGALLIVLTVLMALSLAFHRRKPARAESGGNVG